MAPVPTPEFNSTNMKSVIGKLLDKLQDPTNHIGGILEHINPKGFDDVGKVSSIRTWYRPMGVIDGKKVACGFTRTARNDDFTLRIKVSRDTESNYRPHYNVDFNNMFHMSVLLSDIKLIKEIPNQDYKCQCVFDSAFIEYDPMIHKDFNDFILNELWGGFCKMSHTHIPRYKSFSENIIRIGDISAKYR